MILDSQLSLFSNLYPNFQWDSCCAPSLSETGDAEYIWQPKALVPNKDK